MLPHSKASRTDMLYCVIFGPGCDRCRQLAQNVREAAEALGRPFEIIKMTAAQSRSIFGVTRTPALMVNDRVLVQGRVPEVEEIKQLLEQEVNPS